MQPIDFNGLDTTVHGPVRLGVMTSLRINGELDFTTIKTSLTVIVGIIGMHLQKLEEAGYIKSKKAFVGRRPKTTYRLTPTGRKALIKYLESMQMLLDAVEKNAH